MKLSKPQAEIVKLLQEGCQFRPSSYFYGQEMLLNNGNERRYFRKDTTDSMIKSGILIIKKGIFGYRYHLTDKYSTSTAYSSDKISTSDSLDRVK